MSASTPTAYHSPAGTVLTDALTVQIFTTVNKLVRLPQWGGESEAITVTQGSYRPWTEYSGPTHRGCAAMDATAWNWKNRFYWFDLLGGCPFHRTPSQGDWAEHVHILTCGMGCIDPYAAGQILSAKSGHNGLKGNGPDPDKGRRSGLWPLAIYQGRTGFIHAVRGTTLYDGPSSSRKVIRTAPTGVQVKSLMEVRNSHDNVWFVTDRGEWGFSGKWAA